MRLNLTYHRDEWRSFSGCGAATAGTYKGFYRFGRITTQAWRAYTAGAIREQLPAIAGIGGTQWYIIEDERDPARALGDVDRCVGDFRAILEEL